MTFQVLRSCKIVETRAAPIIYVTSETSGAFETFSLLPLGTKYPSMKQQSFSNHVRYYIPHHFVFYPLSLALLIITVRAALGSDHLSTVWWVMAGIIVLIMWSSFMMRQHYGLINQNRTVRLELRFRYYTLTQKRLELLEDRLSFGQLAALRFASDEELPALVDRALQEGLSPTEIKKQISNWKPDHMRV